MRTTRGLSENEWIDKHASGTLRHARDLGCGTRQMYLHERVAFTFGGGFHLVSRTRILMGTVKAEADCHPFTEGCWQIRRRKAESPETEALEGPSWIRVEMEEGVQEGLGVVLRDASCAWLPEGHVVYAIVAPAKNGEYTGEVLCL